MSFRRSTRHSTSPTGWVGTAPTEGPDVAMTSCPFCGKPVERDPTSWSEVTVEVEEPVYFTAHNACISRAFHRFGKRKLGWLH